VVGDDDVGHGQPFRPARLRPHPRLRIPFAETSLQDPRQSDRVTGINHYPSPPLPESDPENRHLHHHDTIDLLHLMLDPAEDMRVCYRLEPAKLLLIAEDNPCETGPVNLPIVDHMGPGRRHFDEGRSGRLEDLMTDAICVDGYDPVCGQETASFALPAPDPTADYPMAIAEIHGRDGSLS
jgi:hypothetical protein